MGVVQRLHLLQPPLHPITAIAGGTKRYCVFQTQYNCFPNSIQQTSFYIAPHSGERIRNYKELRPNFQILQIFYSLQSAHQNRCPCRTALTVM